MFKKLFIATLFSTIACGQSFAQEPQTVETTGTNLTQGQEGTFGLGNTQSAFFQESEEQKAYRELRNRISTATELMRNAESESDRTKAQEELRTALAEDYDARLNLYQSHLDQLESQLADMRAKLKRRREAKNDMVELRIQVLAAEANDLGWPSSSPGRTNGLLRSGYSPRWNTQSINPSGGGGPASGFGGSR